MINDPIWDAFGEALLILFFVSVVASAFVVIPDFLKK